MCGRFYVDEGTAKEIERVIRGVDLQLQKMRTGISGNSSACNCALAAQLAAHELE